MYNSTNKRNQMLFLTLLSTFKIFGIEAHVCVQQTCLDLLEDGKEVHIIADSVSSQQPYDRELALNRMSQAGAFLTTAQSAAFMLMQSAEHANFRGKIYNEDLYSSSRESTVFMRSIAVVLKALLYEKSSTVFS